MLGRELPREGWAVRGRIGLLAHEPLLYRDLSARENLRFHARLHGVRDRRGSRSCSRRSGWRAAPTSRCARSRAAWSSAWRSAARCCTSPSCCCSTSRSRTSTRARPSAVEPLIGRASGAARVLISHDVERRAGRGRPRARPARRAAGAARRRRRTSAPDDVRGAVPMRRAVGGACVRKDLLRRAAHAARRCPAMAAVQRLDVRAVPLRARPPLGRGRPGRRRAVGHAAVRGGARRSTGCSSPSASRAGSTASCSRRSTARRCSSPRRRCCSASSSRVELVAVPAFAILLLGPVAVGGRCRSSSAVLLLADLGHRGGRDAGRRARRPDPRARADRADPRAAAADPARDRRRARDGAAAARGGRRGASRGAGCWCSASMIWCSGCSPTRSSTSSWRISHDVFARGLQVPLHRLRRPASSARSRWSSSTRRTTPTRASSRRSSTCTCRWRSSRCAASWPAASTAIRYLRTRRPRARPALLRGDPHLADPRASARWSPARSGPRRRGGTGGCGTSRRSSRS